jgi:hypothetical protein
VDQDAVMTEVGQAAMLHRAGDRAEARCRLGRIWDALGEDADALHRCTVARSLADTQEDPAHELAWDLRALQAVASAAQTRAVRAEYASLHLDLAADYLKLHRYGDARRELDLAWRRAGELGGGDHAAGVRAALERMEHRLAGTAPGP